MGTPYKVTSVLTERKGQPPVLVEFENGKINPDLPEPLKCKIYKDGQDPDKKYVTIENEKTTYIGSTDNTNDSFHTYLAIRNRQTHEVQLVKVEAVRASALVERKVQDFRKRSEAVGDDSLLDLSRKFGSKNARRVQEQRLRFEALSKADDHLKAVVKEKVIDASDLITATDDGLGELLPPRKNDAPTPSEVYNINDILTAEEMKSLQEGFETKDSEEQEDFLKRCSPWFKSLLDKCQKNAKSMALLLYAEYIIRMCHRNRQKFPKLRDICDCSEDVARRMSREFNCKRSICMSAADVDKAVLRVIIINLFLADFKVQINTLANSLRCMNTARLRLLVRACGATSSSNHAEVATLKVPISTVKLNPSPRKKRRR